VREIRLGRQLAMASKAVRGRLEERLHADGSSFHSYLVLRHVDARPDSSQRDLAARLGIEGPTLTHHLDRLAAEGLVERVRSTQDRRVWSAVLTPAGRSYLDATVGSADVVDDELRALFTAAEWQTLSVCLDRITATYGRHRLDDDKTVRS
jgi:MarR family transcriptional regulator for hemolysin